MTKPELEARVRDLEAQVSVLMDVINRAPAQFYYLNHGPVAPVWEGYLSDSPSSSSAPYVQFSRLGASQVSNH